MSTKDKITGRVKQAAGDLTGQADLKREGSREERKGEVKDELENVQQKAQDKAAEIANLERKTD